MVEDGREGIFYPSGDDEVAIEFSARGRRHSVIYFWPWFDCCFASHALKNGIDIKTDNLWMPEELLLSKGA